MTLAAQSSTTAIVHFSGCVRFVAIAACPNSVSERLAEYVRGRCDDVLWPDVARRVRELLDDERLIEAIALYFDRTGERWDRERLDLVTVENGVYWNSNEERLVNARR